MWGKRDLYFWNSGKTLKQWFYLGKGQHVYLNKTSLWLKGCRSEGGKLEIRSFRYDLVVTKSSGEFECFDWWDWVKMVVKAFTRYIYDQGYGQRFCESVDHKCYTFVKVWLQVHTDTSENNWPWFCVTYDVSVKQHMYIFLHYVLYIHPVYINLLYKSVCLSQRWTSHHIFTQKAHLLQTNFFPNSPKSALFPPTRNSAKKADFEKRAQIAFSNKPSLPTEAKSLQKGG